MQQLPVAVQCGSAVNVLALLALSHSELQTLRDKTQLAASDLGFLLFACKGHLINLAAIKAVPAAMSQ